MDERTELKVWRIPKVAVALDTSRSHVYRLVANGTLPSVRIGGAVRVPVAALEQWIREHTTAGEAA